MKRSQKFKLQLEMYFNDTIYSNPPIQYSYTMLYDRVTRYIQQREIALMHKPIDLDSAPQARSSIQVYPNSMDIKVATGYCKQQAMFG